MGGTHEGTRRGSESSRRETAIKPVVLKSVILPSLEYAGGVLKRNKHTGSACRYARSVGKFGVLGAPE